MSNTNLASGDHSAADRSHAFVMWLLEEGSSYIGCLKELGGGVEFTIETGFCHFTKKHLRIASK